MNKQNVLISLWFLASSFGMAQTQDSTKVTKLKEVVISDSRFDLNRENSGKTIITISAEELQQNAEKTISQIINTKSGISVVGSNSQAGQPLTTSVRGGQNRQVLVLIDGVAVNDASQIENNFDLQLLDVNQIERIEILKGASSSLYGNRASTAVINIKLKQAENGIVNANFSSFIGTNNSQNDSDLDLNNIRNNVSVNGATGKFNYLVGFTNHYVNGLSAIKSANNESDQFSKINTNVKLGYNFSKTLSVAAYFNHDKYNSGYDDSFYFADQNNVSKNEQLRFAISPKFKYNKGSVTINTAINDVKRAFESDYPATFKAKTFTIDAFNKYAFNDQIMTVIGINIVDNQMENIDDYTNLTNDLANDQIIDPYANLTYISDFGFQANAGVRLNNHSEYGSHLVYNINPSYVFKLKENHSLKLLSSYSTAYITPSLYQLFVPFYGNTDLKPQEDTTIEAGFEYNLDEKLRFSAIYFNRNQDQFIDYVITDYTTYAGEYQNIDNVFEVNGVEVELSYTPFNRLTLDANYTFTEKKNDIIFRIPKQKVNANVNYQFCEKTSANISYQFTGERTSTALDETFTNNRILEAYNLFNVSLNHKVLDNKMTLFASVTNLFNEDYEELYNYTTLGRNYTLGFKLSL